MTPLHQDLNASCGREFVQLLVDLLMGDHIGIRILLGSVKSAKLAINIADVRVVDVSVDDVGHHIIPRSVVGLRQRELSAVIGQCTKFLQW